MTGAVLNTGNMQVTAPRALGGWLQILSIVLLIEIGGIAGGLTGFVPAAAIGSVLLPLLAAAYYLRREGTPWRQLVVGSTLSPLKILGYALLALGLVVLLASLMQIVLDAMGVPAVDYSLFKQLLEGNLSLYLWMAIPVSWGSAAFGEELLVRGFLQHRLTGLVGTRLAVFLQAFIFAIAHFYQGIGGMVRVFVVGLVFGLIYLRCGRNLWPLFIAHGLIDFFAMTVFYLGVSEEMMF